MPVKIPCPACHTDHDFAELLAACTWWREVNVLLGKCPRGARLEFRAETGRVSFGYVYAAGSPHFAGMVDHAVPDLEVAEGDESLDVSLGERSWRIQRHWAQPEDAMKDRYEKEVAVLIAESIGISPSAVKVKTYASDNLVVASWRTSMLLQGEKRDALLTKAQALLPEPLRLRIE